MATLTPTLTLTSSDTSSDALSLTVTDSLTVTVPNVDVQRKSIPTSFTEIFASDVQATYVYFKNTDSSNVVVLREGTGNQSIIDLAALAQNARFRLLTARTLRKWYLSED